MRAREVRGSAESAALPAGRDARPERGLLPLPLLWLALFYTSLALLPYLLGRRSDALPYRNVYTEAVTILSMGGMAMLLLQFALSGRLRQFTLRIGADRSLWIHRKLGEALALVFLLHPVLIVLPRAWVSGRYAPHDLLMTFTSPLTNTGFYAWSLLIVWVLMAMFRDRLGMGYEAWRLSHGLGAAAIAVLATDHAITVGRHGYHAADHWLDDVWVALCALAVAALVWTYLLRPLLVARRGFRVARIERASRSDWYLTLEQHDGTPLAFAAGQFAWISTSPSVFARTEHPFSIASAPSSWPYISFLIRARGDYTATLATLRPGQVAWLDGPQGSFTLANRTGCGVGLVATGAGIGPVLGILRQLRDQHDPRPVRLVYGNTTADQMVCQSEIEAIGATLDFRQVPALTRPGEGFAGHAGRIDAGLLGRVFDAPDRTTWDYFVCGSADAVCTVVDALRGMGIPRHRVVYESLSF